MSPLSFPKKFSFSKALGVAGLWWKKWNSTVFLVLFLAVSGLGVFSWYRSLYAFHWSSDEEQAYRLSKNKQVKFQQNRFDAVLGMIDARVMEHERPPEHFRDVFFGQ
ncbi:MAG: hypothetical protein IPK84_01540 [Candidatus Moraniibacteriota bacterium]|nr:MAG: hypothetical protein IPK84_01540 [Candidatus Moranbacteria bacterium]